jgi:hypothetical protein
MNLSAQLIRRRRRAVDMDQGLSMPPLGSASVHLDGRSQTRMSDAGLCAGGAAPQADLRICAQRQAEGREWVEDSELRQRIW